MAWDVRVFVCLSLDGQTARIALAKKIGGEWHIDDGVNVVPSDASSFLTCDPMVVARLAIAGKRDGICRYMARRRLDEIEENTLIKAREKGLVRA